MENHKLTKRLSLIAKISTFVLFLALIRCIVEPIRLHAVAENEISFEQIEPFLIASLVVAVSLLIITVFWFKQYCKLIIALAVITIAVLVFIKYMYNIQG